MYYVQIHLDICCYIVINILYLATKWHIYIISILSSYGLNHYPIPFFLSPLGRLWASMASSDPRSLCGCGGRQGAPSDMSERFGGWDVSCLCRKIGDQPTNMGIWPSTIGDIYIYILSDWWFGTWIIWLPIYWEYHHPNWLAYFSEG